MSDADFDITDGKNRYEPCPECRRTQGMGLQWLRGMSRPIRAVVCDCGCEGPGAIGPAGGATDKAAFDNWNTMLRS